MKSAVLAAALSLPFAGSASGAPMAAPVVPAGSGVTAPAGMAITPEGTLWVSDHVYGVCRVADVAGSEPAQHGRLVLDQYCALPPAHPPTGPVPEPTAPTGTLQMAFDANGCQPGVTLASDRSKCNFYVAEATSGGSGVWRMHWNPDTKVIDAATKIYIDGADLRVTGLALSPDGHVDFTTKRDTFVRRLENPATAAKGGYVNPPSVGFSQVPGALSLAHVGQALYLAEGAQLTRIAVPSTTGSGGGTAETVPGLPAGQTVTALAGDAANGILYVGEDSTKLDDSVYAVPTAGGSAPAQYDTGFTSLTGLFVDDLGALTIADDPSLGAGVVNNADQGRVWRKPRGSLDPPRVTLIQTPNTFSGSAAPADAAIRFQSRPGVTFACEFASGAETLKQVPCTADTQGVGEFIPTAMLAEGTHHFTVRASTTTETGPVTRFDFTVDTTAPRVTIAPGAPETAVGGAIRIGFSASELGVVFECRLDGGAFSLCSSAKSYSGLANGRHTFEVRATDAAGNVGPVAAWAFTAVPAPPPPPAPAAGAPVVDTVVAAPAAPAPAAQAAAAAVPVLATVRQPRQEISVPCVAVSPSRQRALLSLSGTRALIRFRAPAQARYAKFTLRLAGGRRTVIETIGYATVRSGGAEHGARIALTRSQRSTLRSGHARLAVAYGTCRTQVGQWAWLQPSRGSSNR